MATRTKIYRIKEGRAQGMKQLPPFPTVGRICPVCKKIMNVAHGQIQYSHGGECRKRMRRRRY